MSDAFQQVEVESRAAWREWLEANHASTPGVWLATYKRVDLERQVPYDDVVEEALAFGWVASA